MSFLKKTLASFGIGSAKVDTILQQDVLYPGGKANVMIYVYGGSTEQLIDNIDLSLFCRYVDEEVANSKNSDSGKVRRIHRNFALATWSLPYSFTIGHGETREFSVELDLPWNTPITIGDAKVWLETGLDISMARDPGDKDILTVRPDPLLDAIFNEFEEQGLRIRQVECEAAQGFSLPFVQEFEFIPTTGPFHGRWREVEIIAFRDDQLLELWFEVDRSLRGVGGMLANMLGKGELKRHLSLPADADSKQVGKQVLEFLDSTC